MVYEIKKYNLKGATLYTKKERPDIIKKDDKYFNEDGSKAFESTLWSYTTNPNDGAYSADDKYLPYFANVIEDIPLHYKFEPKAYNNCQLMTEKHGGYLQFWHEETQQVLRIAMNSHYYEPI